MPVEVYFCKETACSFLLATSTKLQRYTLLAAILKSLLLKMAATAFCISRRNSSLEENSETFFVEFFGQIPQFVHA